MRMFIAALVLAGAIAHAGAGDRAPKALAMMSASDVLRAMRCALPIQCAAPSKQKPKSIRKRGKPRATIERM